MKKGRDAKRTDETAESRRGSKKGLILRGGRRRRRKRRNCNYFYCNIDKNDHDGKEEELKHLDNSTK